MVPPISEDFHQEDVIGKPYHHGMIHYGGASASKPGKW